MSQLTAPKDVRSGRKLGRVTSEGKAYRDQENNMFYYIGGLGTAHSPREFAKADDQDYIVTGWLIGPGGRIWTNG